MRSVFPTVLLATTCWVAAAHAETPTRDYVVKAGDSCVSIAIAELGDRRQYKLVHKLNPQLGALPHDLQAGQIIKLPTTGAAKPDANLTAARGSIEVRKPAEIAWDSARRGMDLFRAWRVGSRAQSTAEVTFVDSSRLFMREHTVVIIFGPTTGRAAPRVEAELESGQLESRLAALSDRTFVVRTPSAEATLAKQDALIAVGPTGDSIVANHGGAAVKLRAVDKARRARGRAVAVADGMGSRVRKGALPEKPRPLPPSPTWTTRETRGLSLAGSGAVVRAQWPVASGIKEYRLTVEAQDGTDLAAITVPGTTSEAELQRLPPGQYRVSLSAVDADGFESKRSTPHLVQIDDIVATGPDGAPLALPANTIGTPRLAVGLGTQWRAPTGATCHIADDPAAGDGVFARPGPHTLACASGNQVADVAIEVVAPAITVTQSARAIAAGEVAEFTFTVAPASAAAALEVRATGGELIASARTADGFTAQVRAADANAVVATLVLIGTESEVSRASVDVRAPVATEPPPPVVAPPSCDRCVELGGMIGFASRSQAAGSLPALGGSNDTGAAIASGPVVGARVTAWPHARVGLESELALELPGYRDAAGTATLLGLRAHAIGRLVNHRGLFVHVLAGGRLTALMSTPPTGAPDADLGVHWGLAFGASVRDGLGVRVDARHVMTPARDEGISHGTEITLGIQRSFGHAAGPATP